MNTPKPQFKNALARAVPDFAALDAAIDKVADANNIGSIVRPSDLPAPSQATPPKHEEISTSNVTPLPKKERAPRKQQRAEERKLSVMVPVYLVEALERKRPTGTTKRYVVLSALRAAGYEVRDIDLMEDGRRGRDQ